MDYRCIKVAASSPVKSDITVYATVWYSHTPGGEDGIDIVTIPVRLLAGQTRAEEVVPVYIIGDIYSGNLSHYSDTYATYTLRY